MASEMVHAGAVAVRGIQAALDIVKGALEAWRASPSQVGNPAGDPAVANSLVTAAYAFRVAAREAVAGAGVPASAIATAAERVADTVRDLGMAAATVGNEDDMHAQLVGVDEAVVHLLGTIVAFAAELQAVAGV